MSAVFYLLPSSSATLIDTVGMSCQFMPYSECLHNPSGDSLQRLVSLFNPGFLHSLPFMYYYPLRAIGDCSAAVRHALQGRRKMSNLKCTPLSKLHTTTMWQNVLEATSAGRLHFDWLNFPDRPLRVRLQCPPQLPDSSLDSTSCRPVTYEKQVCARVWQIVVV